MRACMTMTMTSARGSVMVIYFMMARGVGGIWDPLWGLTSYSHIVIWQFWQHICFFLVSVFDRGRYGIYS